jgi:hypothetical protein
MTGGAKTAVQPDGVEDAMKRAMRLLAVRARSCHEIRDRLSRIGFDEATVEAVEVRLLNVGLLDDSAFAAEVVRRGVDTGRSARLTRQDLRRFGVDAETADDAWRSGKRPPAATFTSTRRWPGWCAISAVKGTVRRSPGTSPGAYFASSIYRVIDPLQTQV